MDADSITNHKSQIQTVALPCRVSVYEDAGKVKVATLKRTQLLQFFGNPELSPVARQVEATSIRIIDKACG
jgi:uncharacterized protein (DUF302 family)